MGHRGLANIDAARDREFWRAMLQAGGFTALPRWTLQPVGGSGEHAVAISAELRAALGRLAGALVVSPATLLLTAHARVLGALSGERAVTVGYAVAGRPPLPLRISLEAGSWRELLLQAARAESALRAHRDFPVDALRHELGLDEARCESLFEAEAGAGGGFAGEAVLAVRLVAGEELRLRYRRDALDEQATARIAGYHLAALAAMTADPDAGHAQQSLLSAEELAFQLEGLAGPCRTLPDRRAHELFEEQARTRPEAIAAVSGDQRLRYRELNARANRLGRLLLAQGLEREGVVAVVCERNLDWLAAVLAIFKAGGAYLPIEPQYPVDRILRVLSRAGCRLVLSETASSGQLDQALAALPETRRLLIDTADLAALPDEDLGVKVEPGQLAYLYFTSGSTGEPKGAMCEHAGLVNHLFAKIDDLEIGPDSAVAQTAPLCFDISLWQLIAALMVGGRTLLLDQATIMDAERFIEAIVAGQANVVQLVPSYLEVVLACLEQQPRKLPDLRYLAVTGEPLKKALAQRWFAAQPGIRLVNAYGLTETSDDTNHEIMEAPPQRERVPLGRAVNNVHVYVVDEQLSPVPLGAPGQIVFSGVCVGRGYINDPERTQRAYGADPYRPGMRLFRSGDYGRWLPEGKLEYLGRRDDQVKISGFRIEIGEIENRLLRLPGIRAAAVVAAVRPDGGRQLVAFYAGAQEFAAEALRAALAETLPAYMLPARFEWRPTLPLTANGKVDRKTMQDLAAAAAAAPPPATGEALTATERELAGAWAEVLGIAPAQIERGAHFFELGGTSLTALRLLVKLNRALSLQELIEHPVLGDLAGLLDARAGPGLPTGSQH